MFTLLIRRVGSSPPNVRSKGPTCAVLVDTQVGIRPAINNKSKMRPKKNMGKQQQMAKRVDIVYPATRLHAMRPRAPKIATVKDGIRVKNREIVLQVDRVFTAGTAPFTVNTRRLGFSNTVDTGAGLFGNTTWWGRMATLYDRFKIHNLKLQFEPTLALTHSGQVALYVDPDFDPTTPSSYLQMSGNDKVVAKQVCWELNRDYGPAHFNRLPWYDTTQGVSSTGTAGTIVLATSAIASPVAGFAGTYTCGYLWMEYDVEFTIPSNPATATPPAALTAKESQTTTPTLFKTLADSVLAYRDEIAKEIEDFPELQKVGTPLLLALASYASTVAVKSRSKKDSATKAEPLSVPTEGGVLTEKGD